MDGNRTENKEKHFIVTELTYDEDDNVISCTIEAVISKRSMIIEWKTLQDSTQWLYGWQ
ncbi:TIGR02450 family Trp-rich protein [Sinobacterium caligoides]|uniref:TIGR02450 family Trp-rich protein n=1 Tax=Sinobacterium caligoides TaxID=933926 RepID=UPI001FE9199F|nr:TIGR02450 family Trp-rich protein [Sinobacterium caligoides]